MKGKGHFEIDYGRHVADPERKISYCIDRGYGSIDYQCLSKRMGSVPMSDGNERSSD